MSPKFWCCALTIVIYYVALSEAVDRSRTQFEKYFPTFDTFSRPVWEKTCKAELRNYRNESLPDPPGDHLWAWNLVNCNLENMDEVSKASMATTGILLSLLPIGLAQIGPSVAELSLLSARRPLLAALLGYGTMSPNPTIDMDFQDIISKIRNQRTLFHKVAMLQYAGTIPFLARVALSVLEYAIGMAAAGNCFYQIWRLTYRAVSLAPISAYIYGIPEAATLFGWVVLNLPIHLMGFLTFAISYGRPADHYKKGNLFISWIKSEFTPSVFAGEFKLDKRTTNEGWQILLGAFTRLVATLHSILGIVLVGSVLFLTLADSLPIIYAFIGAAVGTRIVLVFELQCLGKNLTVNDGEEGHAVSIQCACVKAHSKEISNQH